MSFVAAVASGSQSHALLCYLATAKHKQKFSRRSLEEREARWLCARDIPGSVVFYLFFLKVT